VTDFSDVEKYFGNKFHILPLGIKKSNISEKLSVRARGLPSAALGINFSRSRPAIKKASHF